MKCRVRLGTSGHRLISYISIICSFIEGGGTLKKRALEHHVNFRPKMRLHLHYSNILENNMLCLRKRVW